MRTLIRVESSTLLPRHRCLFTRKRMLPVVEYDTHSTQSTINSSLFFQLRSSSVLNYVFFNYSRIHEGRPTTPGLIFMKSSLPTTVLSVLRFSNIISL